MKLLIYITQNIRVFIKGGGNVKKVYYILISAIIAVVALYSTEVGTKLNTCSPSIKTVAVAVVVILLCILLFLISRDKNINRVVRILSVIGIAFFVVCFIGGLIAEFANYEVSVYYGYNLQLSNITKTL